MVPVASATPWGPAAQRASSSARRGSRTLALGALALVALALVFVLVKGHGAREYRVIMQNAGLLVPGDLVRIGGVQAGTVKSLDLTRTVLPR